MQLDGERDGPGAELHAGRAQSVGGLEAVAALHAAPTLRTVADLDVEAAYDGVHRREIFLILRGHAGHFDGAAAGGTRLGDAGRMGLVDPRRTPAASLPPVPCTGSSAWTPAAALPPVLGEGRGLSAAGPPGGVELLLEVFAAPLPPVAVADSAYQVLVQLDVLPLELLDALVSRLLLPPGRLRPAASAAPLGHTPCIGTCARSCTPLRGFSRPYPVTEDVMTSQDVDKGNSDSPSSSMRPRLIDPVSLRLRFKACAIDLLMVVGIEFAFRRLVSIVFGVDAGDRWVEISLFGTGWVYFVAAETRGVGTVGKRLTGLKVVSLESGLPPDWPWASFRYLVKVATLLILGGVLFGWVFLDSRRRALHDYVAGTAVAREGSSGGAASIGEASPG